MKISSRLGAFAVHVLISALILIILLSIILFVWFPNGLIFAGGIEGLKIVMAVDLVLGPLLTLIVFKPEKKGLKFDLSAIAALQILCLSYGMWMVYSQRPLVQVIIDDGIHVLSASDVQEHDLAVNKIMGAYPKNVMMDLPDDQATWGSVKLMTELADAIPFAFREDLYLPMPKVDAANYQQRIEIILETYSDDSLKTLSKVEELDCNWLPMISTHFSGYACHHRENGIMKLSRGDL